MCGFTSRERKKNEKFRELSGLEVNLVIKKDRLRSFGLQVEAKGNAECVKWMMDH